MRIFVTNWTVPPVETGGFSMHIDPPGEVSSMHFVKDGLGNDWLRVVSVEKKIKQF